MTRLSQVVLRGVRSQVPEPLRGSVPRRRDLRSSGITDGRLRSRAVRRPFCGVHADAVAEASVERRIRDVVPLLRPDGVIGGWAAAWVHGARVLDGTAGGRELPVVVCVPRTRRMRERPGMRPWQSDLHGEVQVVRGVPVTSAVRTAVDLARRCRLRQARRRGLQQRRELVGTCHTSPVRPVRRGSHRSNHPPSRVT